MPNQPGMNKGQGPKRGWIVYVIYGIILVSLGYLWLGQDGGGKPQPIKWA